ncbi:MAG: 50S ribosomal protein L29 [Planctomycetota bacterium]|jgi:large subunit ribosomal protein L29
MKIQELREMKSEALHNELDRLRRHLFDLRAQAVTEKLVNPNQLGQTRRDIARIFTVLNERGETGIEEQQYHLEALATHTRGG